MEQLTDTHKMAKAVKAGISRVSGKLHENDNELKESWAAERMKLQNEVTRLNQELNTIR